MKLPLVISLVLTAAGFAAEPAPRVVSPEIAADRRVTFRLNAPKAAEVVLSGEFMRGTKPLEKDAGGVWSVTVGPIEPEIYHYNLTVDGTRLIDPANPDVKFGSTPGTLQSILEIRGDAPAFYDGQAVPHGEVRTLTYESKSIPALRRVTVYLPPGYDADANRATRYPVLYLLHGANADETAWTRLGRANLILDNLIAAGKTKPFIVVMPFGYSAHPHWATGDERSKAAPFGDVLLNDIMPVVESQLRIRADREHRALVGLSMGGGQALSVGLNHLERFAYVGGFSSGLGNVANFSKTYAALIGDAPGANQKLKMLWIGCGTEDGAFNNNKALAEFFAQHKIAHTFRDTPGAHTWMVWRRYLHEIAPQLFR